MPARLKTAEKRDNSLRIWLDRSAVATGLGAAALAAIPDRSDRAIIMPDTIQIQRRGGNTGPLTLTDLVSRTVGEVSAPENVVRLRSDDEEDWGKAEQKRFQELAVAEAVGELTEEDAYELEALTRERRARQHPRSGDEVLWQFEQRRLTAQLLETLSQYVEFYEGSSSAWYASREDSD